MNYLAHAYLSFGNSAVLTGNMISDFVKGKKQFDYPPDILKGIQLHRAIDEFTDTHEATASLKAFYRPAYRLYSGAFADVTYDYFLANDPDAFHNPEALYGFTQDTFALLDATQTFFPAPFEGMYPYMRSQNWLYNYRLESGIRKSFGGVERRAAYIEESDTAFELFLKHKAEMQVCYNEFFPHLKKFAAHKLEQFLTS